MPYMIVPPALRVTGEVGEVLALLVALLFHPSGGLEGDLVPKVGVRVGLGVHLVRVLLPGGVKRDWPR